MKKIIAFTDSVTACECCGKSNLKGTYCVEIDGVERYYGSMCTFKKHGFDEAEYKAKLNEDKKRDKALALAEQDAAWAIYKKDVSDRAFRQYMATLAQIQSKYPSVWKFVCKTDLRQMFV